MRAECKPICLVVMIIESLGMGQRCLFEYGCVFVYVCICMYLSMRACVCLYKICVCACMYMRAYICVCALYKYRVCWHRYYISYFHISSTTKLSK